MDGLSVAASITSVINLSVKVAALCIQYSVAVKNARGDAQRLQTKADSIEQTFKDLMQKLDQPQSKHLLATRKSVQPAIHEYLGLLQKLHAKLEPRGTRLGWSRARSLRWPFQSNELEGVLAALEAYERRFFLPLQIDQMYVSTSSKTT